MADGTDPGFLFWANPNQGNITYAQLQQRRAIAQSLASRKQGFPKNIGEGLTYLGESIGDAAMMRAAMQAEQAQAARERAVTGTLTPRGMEEETPTPARTSTTAPLARPAEASAPKPPEEATPEPAQAQAPTKVASAEPDESISTSPPAPATPPPDVNTGRDQVAQAIVANNGTNPNTAAPPPAPAAGQPANPAVVPPPTVPQAAAGGPGAGAMVPPSATPQLPPGQAPQAPPQVTNIPKQPVPQQPYETPAQILTPTEEPSMKPTAREKQAWTVANDPTLSPEARQRAMTIYQQEYNQRQHDYDQWFAANQARKAQALAEPGRQVNVASQQQQLDLHNRFDVPRNEAELAAAQAQAQKSQLEAAVAARTGGLGTQALLEPLQKSAETVKALPQATLALRNVRDQLDRGVITGTFANQELAVAKLKEALGFTPGDPRIANTESFKAMVAPIWAAARAAQAGGANISDADIRNAQQSVAGDITLDAKTFPRVLDSLERINTALAIQHQQKVRGAAAGDPRAQQLLQDSYGLPMETIIPRRFQDRLVDNPHTAQEFNETFKTPGLAERIIAARPRPQAQVMPQQRPMPTPQMVPTPVQPQGESWTPGG